MGRGCISCPFVCLVFFYESFWTRSIPRVSRKARRGTSVSRMHNSYLTCDSLECRSFHESAFILLRLSELLLLLEETSPRASLFVTSAIMQVRSISSIIFHEDGYERTTQSISWFRLAIKQVGFLQIIQQYFTHFIFKRNGQKLLITKLSKSGLTKS